MTFAQGENALSDWMQDNAFVTWVVDQEPWRLEERLIAELSLPLNLDQNAAHPFRTMLSGIRRAARENARLLPIATAT